MPEDKSGTALKKALRGAVEKRIEKEDEVEQFNLVFLAGSLYLVADFISFWNRAEMPTMKHGHLL